MAAIEKRRPVNGGRVRACFRDIVGKGSVLATLNYRAGSKRYKREVKKKHNQTIQRIPQFG